MRGIYENAYELGDEIVAYYETSDEVKKRNSRNPELVDYYFKVRRKKQNHFVWKFLQNKSGNFYVNVADNSRAVEKEFLTPLKEDDK